MRYTVQYISLLNIEINLKTAAVLYKFDIYSNTNFVRLYGSTTYFILQSFFQTPPPTTTGTPSWRTREITSLRPLSLSAPNNHSWLDKKNQPRTSLVLYIHTVHTDLVTADVHVSATLCVTPPPQSPDSSLCPGGQTALFTIYCCAWTKPTRWGCLVLLQNVLALGDLQLFYVVHHSR